MRICVELDWKDMERILKPQMSRFAPNVLSSSEEEEDSLFSSNKDKMMQDTTHNNHDNNAHPPPHTHNHTTNNTRAAASSRPTANVASTQLVIPAYVPAPRGNLKRKARENRSRMTRPMAGYNNKPTAHRRVPKKEPHPPKQVLISPRRYIEDIQS